MIITAVANFVCVWIIKFIEEKAKKDKLWKVEVTLRPHHALTVANLLNEMNIPFNWVDIKKYHLFNIYCATINFN